MKLKEKLAYLSRHGGALLAANFYNFETLSGILAAAAKKQVPVSLQLSEGSIDDLGLKVAVSMARSALSQYGVEGWLHLDHGSSIDIVKRCLDAGFDSVMIDASERPFNENAEMTSAVVRLASAYGATVEAELGFVAKLGQAQVNGSFTQPDEAARFVKETGVDALAVAIGSAHGFYKEPPRLQLDLLREIHAATPAALVLHGSSGIPDDQLRKAIALGISKVNLATETKNTFICSLRDVLTQSEEIDLRKIFPQATQFVVRLIEEKIDLVSSVHSTSIL